MTLDPRLIEAVVAKLLAERNGILTGDEIAFRCIMPHLHRNGDATASAAFNRVKAVWNCKACGAKGTLRDLARALGIRTAFGRPQRETVSDAPTTFVPLPAFLAESEAGVGRAVEFLRRRQGDGPDAAA